MYLVLNTQDTLVQTPGTENKTKTFQFFRISGLLGTFFFPKEKEEEHLLFGRNWVLIDLKVPPVLQAEALWMTLGMTSWNDEGLCRHALKSLDLNHLRRFFYVCVCVSRAYLLYIYFMF